MRKWSPKVFGNTLLMWTRQLYWRNTIVCTHAHINISQVNSVDSQHNDQWEHKKIILSFPQNSEFQLCRLFVNSSKKRKPWNHDYVDAPVLTCRLVTVGRIRATVKIRILQFFQTLCCVSRNGSNMSRPPSSRGLCQGSGTQAWHLMTWHTQTN